MADLEKEIRNDLRRRATAFRKDVEALEAKWQITLSRQDSHGAFVYVDDTVEGTLHETENGYVYEKNGRCFSAADDE